MHWWGWAGQYGGLHWEGDGWWVGTHEFSKEDSEVEGKPAYYPVTWSQESKALQATTQCPAGEASYSVNLTFKMDGSMNESIADQTRHGPAPAGNARALPTNADAINSINTATAATHPTPGPNNRWASSFTTTRRPTDDSLRLVRPHLWHPRGPALRNPKYTNWQKNSSGVPREIWFSHTDFFCM
jgi:hypothetical protein